MHCGKKQLISFVIILFCLAGTILGLNDLWFSTSDAGKQLIFTENTYGTVIFEGDIIEQTFQAEDTFLSSILILAVGGAENDVITVTLSDQEGKSLAAGYMEMDPASDMLEAAFNRKLETGNYYRITVTFENIGNTYSIYHVPAAESPEIYGSSSLNGTPEDSALFVWFEYKFFRWDLFLLFLIPLFLLEIILILKPSNAIISHCLEGIGVICCSLLCINAVNYLGTPDAHSGGSHMLNRAWFVTIFLILMLIGLFTVTVRYLSLGIMIPLSACFLYGLIAHYVMLFRGTPFLPIDILAVNTAKTVALNYDYSIDNIIIFSAASYLIILSFCVCIRTRISMNICKSAITFAVLTVLCITCCTPKVTQMLRLTPYYYSQEEGIKRYGAIFNFITNIRSCFREKPDGYSPERIVEIANSHVRDEWESNKQPPNLIVIMNESWADINISNGLGGAISCMPHITRLAESDNAISGNVVVPTFGGGTNKSEFAFLTGSSMSFGLTGSCYDLDCREGVASMVSALKDLGYYTIALHPAYSRNWDRDIGYKKLGFDQFYALEDLSDYEFEYLRSYGYVSDSSLYNVIYDLTDEILDQPVFIFCVTIQNHGGYDDESYPATVEIEDPQAAQYLSLVSETDKAFARLAEHYRQNKTETIILMFGDHMPLLDNIDKLISKDSLEYYTTPYIIWSNSPLSSSDDIPYCSVNYLQSYFFDAAGLPLTGYQKFLKETALKYPIIHGGKYYDCQRVPHLLSEKELPEEIINYQWVQYNNLFGGENRCTQLFSEKNLQDKPLPLNKPFPSLSLCHTELWQAAHSSCISRHWPAL